MCTGVFVLAEAGCSTASGPRRADHSVTAMVATAGVSARHLTRLFHDELDTTPARRVALVRLEAAQALIDGRHTVTSAAARRGLGSDETLRRVFLRHLNISPTAHRYRFDGTDAVSWTP